MRLVITYFELKQSRGLKVYFALKYFDPVLFFSKLVFYVLFYNKENHRQYDFFVHFLIINLTYSIYNLVLYTFHDQSLQKVETITFLAKPIIANPRIRKIFILHALLIFFSCPCLCIMPSFNLLFILCIFFFLKCYSQYQFYLMGIQDHMY